MKFTLEIKIRPQCHWCSNHYWHKKGKGVNNRFCSQKCLDEYLLDLEMDEQT